MIEPDEPIKKGKAIIITAPSGAGKSTIANHLISAIEDLEYSVSATTRNIRADEMEGKDYYFISKEEFLNKITNNEFVEWEEVYKDIYYGTLKSEVERIWKLGKSVLFVVDVIGAKDLKYYFGSMAFSIFIEPPSIEILQERILKRKSETKESFEKRMDRVKMELLEKDKFDLIIINDHLDKAIIHAEAEVRNFLFFE